MGFWTIVFIFIVISTTFRPICPPTFFRCLSNLGAFTELRTTSFIESTGVTYSDSVCHNRVQVLSIPVLLLTCSQDWTCNFQMIFSQGNQLWCYVSCWTVKKEFLELNVLTWLGLLLICMIFFCAHIQIVFSSNLFNYRFPYCIHLYTWSTQQVIVAQHMCWFLKVSDPRMITFSW